MIRLDVVDAASLCFGNALRIETMAGPLGWERPLGSDGEHVAMVSMARDIGLKRPGSAPFSTLAATILLHAIQPTIANVPVLVCACSSTGPAAVALRFETTGMTNGWGTADPFWLQNTLPSFSASAIFNALRLRGQALGFAGDFSGIYSGLYFSAVALATGKVQRAAVVIAEDGLQFLHPTEERPALSWKGCVALVLQSADADAGLPTLSLAASASGGESPSDPADGYRLLDDIVQALRLGRPAKHWYSDTCGQTYVSNLIVRSW